MLAFVNCYKDSCMPAIDLEDARPSTKLPSKNRASGQVLGRCRGGYLRRVPRSVERGRWDFVGPVGDKISASGRVGPVVSAALLKLSVLAPLKQLSLTLPLPLALTPIQPEPQRHFNVILEL